MEKKLTPAMHQFVQAKKEYPDAIVLFRMGDFYECFYEDAIAVSQLLGITLTGRGKDDSRAPLAGIPYHALDKYLKQLVQSGKQIAICEQLEDPKFAKGIVKRGITRVITPGTATDDAVLQPNVNNFLCAVFEDNNQFGIAACDISTNEFFVCECDKNQFLSEIAKINPSEIIYDQLSAEYIELFKRQKRFLTKVDSTFFFITLAQKRIAEQFENASVLADCALAQCASNALLEYAQHMQKSPLSHIKHVKKILTGEYVHLDVATIKNLELLLSATNTRQGCLLDILDKTKTSMGARLLRQWIVRPLRDVNAIQQRLCALDCLISQSLTLADIQDLLSHCKDMERLATKIYSGTANPRDLLALKDSLQLLPMIKSTLNGSEFACTLFQRFIATTSLDTVVQLIDKTIKEEAGVLIREGNVIKRGFSSELDDLWQLKNDAHSVIARMEQEEIEKTGITTLKIRYNRVFGYYIELTKRFEDKVPSYYERKQSTVNSERYVTAPLKELEVKIASAQDRINEIEYAIYMQLLDQLKEFVAQIQHVATHVATIDVLCSFATVSIRNRYTKPHIYEGYDLELKDSRHPVIEASMESFVSNDCLLTHEKRFGLITGPNMSGKSTYMRQIALNVLLAHIGCYVACSQAKIPLTDQIFTRVGSYDDVSQGRSTFMIEMMETAYILNNATKSSFLILDEIGAGTSTFDGVSLAWSIAEYLVKTVQAKTLFSTHYHVLSHLDSLTGVFNIHLAIDEHNGKITFLRKIKLGATDKSYGIYVAQLANLPASVIEHAKRIQFKLEEEDEMHTHIVVERNEHAISGFAKLKQHTLFDTLQKQAQSEKTQAHVQHVKLQKYEDETTLADEQKVNPANVELEKTSSQKNTYE